MNLDSITDVVAVHIWDKTTDVVARHHITDNTDWVNAMSDACDLAGHVSPANGTEDECLIYVVEQPVHPICASIYSVARVYPDGTSVWDNVRADCARDAVGCWYDEQPF